MTLWRVVPLLGLLGVLATACTSETTPQPRLYSQNHEMPSVVLSAEYPSATISFEVSGDPATGPEEMTLRVTGPDDLRLIRNGVPLSSGGNTLLTTCEGPECFGDYQVEASWLGTGTSTIDIEYLSTTVLLEAPSYSLVTVSDVEIDGGVPVIASGTVTTTRRDWVAIRAPNGIADLERFVLEFVDMDGREARIVTAEGIAITDGRSSVPVEMPASCNDGQCGTALTVEYNTLLDDGRAPEDRSFEWRILDYNPRGASFWVEHQTEWLPTISGTHHVEFGELDPGETVEKILTISLPRRLLETATPERPPFVHVRVSRWAELDLTVAAENSGLAETQVDGIDDIEPIHCPDIHTCSIELTVRATRTTATTETAEYRLSVEAIAHLPHLPSVHHFDAPTIVESS